MSRTQVYIEKFCEYINRLILIWNGKKKLDLRGDFVPFDESIVKFPYHENIALSVCSPEAKLFVHMLTYSGAYVCVDKGEVE